MRTPNIHSHQHVFVCVDVSIDARILKGVKCIARDRSGGGLTWKEIFGKMIDEGEEQMLQGPWEAQRCGKYKPWPEFVWFSVVDGNLFVWVCECRLFDCTIIPSTRCTLVPCALRNWLNLHYNVPQSRVWPNKRNIRATNRGSLSFGCMVSVDPFFRCALLVFWTFVFVCDRVASLVLCRVCCSCWFVCRFFVMCPARSTPGTEPNPPPWRAGPEGLLGKGFATIDDTCNILPKQASSSTWVMELKTECTFGSPCDIGFARTMGPWCSVVDVRRRGWICYFAKFRQMPHCRSNLVFLCFGSGYLH